MVHIRLVLALMVSLAVATVASTAPVPRVDPKAKTIELEGLWADLYKDEPVASKALLKMFKQPEYAVPFLKEKLQPLKLEQKRCEELLKNLGSEDEKTWKLAWDELDYLDPRLAIDLVTLMTDITENPARTRMVELCSQRKADSLAGQKITINNIGVEGYNFRSNGGSWWAEHLVERIGVSSWSIKPSWRRAARAIAILEEIGTPEALKLLELMAEGHADAGPTKAAKESLERLKKK